MLYWLIPYLVVFNATGSEYWKHGPECLFKAEIEAGIKLEDKVLRMTNYEIDFSCRPLNESSIRCRVKSIEIKNSETHENDASEEKKVVQRDSNITNWTFEVQYDRKGLHSIDFLNTEEDFRRDIMRAIFDVTNVGSDFVSELKVGTSLLSNEVSPIRTCEAKVHVDLYPILTETAAWRIGLYMDIPSFTKRLENETLVIMKRINPGHCSVKTRYFFSNHSRQEDNRNYNITGVETGIFFDRHNFGGATKKEGTVTMKHPEHSGTTQLMSGLVRELLQVRLEAIRGATEKL